MEAHQESFDHYLEFGGPLDGASPDQIRNWKSKTRNSGGPTAIFMDTTTIDRAWKLLQGRGEWLADPSALIDLANVVSAVIMYDTIFHLENAELPSEDFNEFLHLPNDPVFIKCPTSSAGPDVVSFLDGQWAQSADYLKKLESGPRLSEDMARIRLGWETLCGRQIDWNSADAKSRANLGGHRSTTRVRQAWKEFSLILTDRHGEYNLARIISYIEDFNNRGLYNWGVAYALDLRYIPNIYRLPFHAFLVSKGYAKRQELLAHLDYGMRQRATATLVPRERMQLPLFISAILRKAGNLDEFREILASFRLRAAPYRQKWAEVEFELRNGNGDEGGRLLKVLAGEEVPKIRQWCAAGAAVATVAWTAAAIEGAHPWLQSSLDIAGHLTAAAAVAKGIEILAGGLFRPRLRLLRGIADTAQAMADAREKVAKLWGIRPFDERYVRSLKRVIDLDNRVTDLIDA